MVSRELRCQEMKKECRVRRGNNGSNLHYAVIQEGGSFSSGYRRRHCINALNRKQIPIVGFHLQSVSQSVIALRKAQLLQGDWSNTPSQVQSRKAPTLRRQLYSSCKRNAHSAKWWMQLQEICIHSKTHRVFGARVGRGCDKHLTEAGAYLGSCNSRSCLGSSSSSSRFCCGRNTTATACFHKQ